MNKISAVVITKNEEENIKDCLVSLSFCDEVIIIDDNSIDKTTSIAKKLGVKVFKKKLNDNFADQRNFALSKAKNEWVLFVDADERVSKILAGEIKVAVKNGKVNGYYIRRKDFLWGKEIGYGEIGSTRFLRLARKNKGKWERGVHEKWIIEGKTFILKHHILHFPHRTIGEFIKHIDHFSTLHAEENIKEGKNTSLFKILFMPFAHFIRNYILRLGFLDGMRGFIIAFLMSFHSFLSWAKMYLLQKYESI